MAVVFPSAARLWKMTVQNHKGQLEMAIMGGIRMGGRERRRGKGKGEFPYTYTQTYTFIKTSVLISFFLFVGLCPPIIPKRQQKSLQKMLPLTAVAESHHFISEIVSSFPVT